MHNTIYQRFGIFRAVFLGVGLLAFFATSVRAEDVDEARIRRKMERIMLESLDYRQATIVDVIHDLNDLSRDSDADTSDPRERGINFLLNIGDTDDFWDIGSIDDIPLVTLKARYVSLRVALDMVMEMTGLEYRVNGNIVMISRKAESSNRAKGLRHPLLSATSIQVVKSFDAKKVRKPEDWRWFYYVPGTAKLSERAVEVTKLGFKKEPKGTHVVLLFDSSSNTVFWKWIAAPSGRIFASTDAVNLADICFGMDPLVEDLWLRHNSDWDHRYEVRSRLLTGVVYNSDVSHLEQVMEWIQDDWVDANSPEFSQLCKTFDAQTNRLEQMAINLVGLQDRIDDLDRRIENARNEEIRTRGTWNNTSAQNTQRRLQNERNKLAEEYRRLNKEFDNRAKQANETLGKIKKALADYRKSREKEPLEAAVRKMEFTVSVVMKGEETR